MAAPDGVAWATEDVVLVGTGAVMPEAVAAAQSLHEHGVRAQAVCLTSADLIFRSVLQRGSPVPVGSDILDRLLPLERPHRS